MTATVDLLLVDDRADALLALTTILEHESYRLVTASSGTEALRRVLDGDFAVILLDVMMPDLSGFEVASIIKQRERSRDTPILFLTAAGDDINFIYRGYSVGAVDYLLKPIEPEVLRAKVAIFVELFVKERRIRAQAEALRAADRRERELVFAELQLRNERRYRNLAEAIPQIVWTAEPSGRTTYVNRCWSEYTGRSIDDALANLRAAIHPDDREQHEARWHQALTARTALDVESRIRRHDGEYRWHVCRAVPERDHTDAIVGWLGTFTDFDDRRRALDAAWASVHARDEFLSIASHELRTPLTTLQLRLESLADDLGSARAHADVTGQLASARRQCDRLQSLIDRVFDVSRITCGRLTLQRETFELSELARELVDRFSELAANAGCRLVLRTTRAVTGTWDRLRIDQVLQNLVGNAVKYAPKTAIEISIDGDDKVARMSVRDHGPGIAPQDTERIFGQFERAVSARHHGGLGMGLYIARQITLAHGGTIAVDSTPGNGAIFTVALPRAADGSGPRLAP